MNLPERVPTPAPRSSVAALVVWLLLLMGGCSPLIAGYDQTAYSMATSLKVDVTNLMAGATEAYDADAVEAMETRLAKAYEYAKGRPNNALVARQWQIMNDPGGAMAGGFFRRWKDNGPMSKAFVDGAVSNVSAGFDQIIGLESGLIKDDK